VVDPTPDLPLASLADLKGELGLSLATNTNDSTLLRKLRAASARVESYCGRKFSRATTTDRVKSRGKALLLLERRPIVSIGLIVDPDGATVDATAYEIKDAKAGLVSATASFWQDTAMGYADFGEGTRIPETERTSYAVTYDAGFVTGWHVDPRTDTTAAAVTPIFPAAQKNIPADLEEAVIKLATAMWRTRGSARDPTVAAESLSKFSVTYGGDAVAGLDDVRDGAGGMPKDVVGILDRYAEILQA
jgi:hypothetical protein